MVHLKVSKYSIAAAVLLQLFFIRPFATGQVAADSNYIRLFPETFTARVYLSEKISIFNLSDRQEDKVIYYYPNNVLSLGAGLTIRGISLNLSTQLPFHQDKQELYGRTRRYDVQLHRYRRKLALDVYLQRYKGFHLNTLEHVDSVSGPTAFSHFPNMRAYTLGVSAMYVFNGERFTMKPPVNQQEWQKKSAGSFLLGGSVFAHRINNEDKLILPEFYKHPAFFDGVRFSEISNYGLTVNAGYGYTFVLKTHWFLGASAEVGAGPGYSVVKDQAGERYDKVGLSIRSNARLAAGYNSEKWYGGFFVIFHTDRYSMPFEGTRLGTSQGIFRVVAARRFASFKLRNKKI